MRNPTNPERLSERELLIAIFTKLDTYEKSLEGLVMKVVIALIAVVAANVGLKFVGSPWWVGLTAYVSFFASAFLLGSVFVTWRKITWPSRLVRLVFATFMAASSITRLFLFEPEAEVAPAWFPGLMDGFFVILAALLVIAVWNSWDGDRQSH